MLITGIMAVAQNGCIGKEGQMPWPKDSEDLGFFKRQTMGKACIMGRKTYESMRHVDWGTRIPLVVSHRQHPFYLTLDQAVHEAGSYSYQVMVIGGAEIFKSMINRMHCLMVTHIEGEYDGDTFFDIHNLPSDWSRICEFGRRSIFMRRDI